MVRNYSGGSSILFYFKMKVISVKMLGKLLLWFLLAILNAFLTWGAIVLFTNDAAELGIIMVIIIFFIDFAVINPKGYPYRYTIPALSLLLILTVYPIFYTLKIAFTNYGTGHLFTRSQVVEQLLKTYVTDEDATPYSYKVYVHMEDFAPTENFIVIFTDGENQFLAERPQIISVDSEGKTTRSVAEYKVISNGNVIIGDDQYDIVYSLKNKDQIMAVEGTVKGKQMTYQYFFSFDDPDTLSNQRIFMSKYYLKYLDSVEMTNSKRSLVRFGNVYGFRKLVDSRKKYRIDKELIEENGRVVERTVLVNVSTGIQLQESDGTFYDITPQGQRMDVGGYRGYVGLRNFEKMFTDSRFTGPFIKILIWTFAWAILSVFFSFIIGLGFAVMLNDSKFKGRNLYRTLLLIPWAVPAFISVLVWRNGFFNETYGILNKIVLGQWFGIDAVRWLGDAFMAKVSVLIVNVWLGFPYMMMVCLGALQSIPGNLYEAASIDGATKIRKFSGITMPLLMTSVAPLLIGAFAFNFNNFTNIYLLTRGGPPMSDSLTNAGSTDILISYTYKLAFQGERGQDFGYASAIALFIFLIVAGISFFQFKFAGTFEEVNRG